MAFIIGLVGAKRVGKDTVADYLVEHYDFRKVVVADPLKRAVREIFGFTAEQLEGADKERVDERWGFSPREALQFVGTDLFRDAFGACFPHIGDNLWAHILRNRLSDSRAGARIVVSDVRFPNEARAISDAGGVLVRIHRANTSHTAADCHASETSVGAIETAFAIDNSGTMGELYAQVVVLIAARS